MPDVTGIFNVNRGRFTKWYTVFQYDVDSDLTIQLREGYDEDRACWVEPKVIIYYKKKKRLCLTLDDLKILHKFRLTTNRIFYNGLTFHFTEKQHFFIQKRVGNTLRKLTIFTDSWNFQEAVRMMVDVFVPVKAIYV